MEMVDINGRLYVIILSHMRHLKKKARSSLFTEDAKNKENIAAKNTATGGTDGNGSPPARIRPEPRPPTSTAGDGWARLRL